MINPVILGAVVVQSIISGSSRIAGAIAGYAITTGIMLWGLSVYNEGNLITFFGIPLSQQAFIIACMVWYGFDTKEFIAAKELMAQGSSQQT